MKIIVLNNQSIFDIAIQTSGSAEAAFELALSNDLSLTDILAAGNTLNIPQIKIGNRQIAGYYQTKGLNPATSATSGQMLEILGEGIHFMGIEFDFTVS